VKVSAVEQAFRSIRAPAAVFKTQAEFIDAFEHGQLERDFVAVLPAQGPKAIGMPELHKLTPYLGLLQDRGFKVALLTDGRMSGASGKVLAAIQVTPEAAAGGVIGKIRDGDTIEIDSDAGKLMVSTKDDINVRPQMVTRVAENHVGMGRELFAVFRQSVGSAEDGASIFGRD
jgi:phosphogluconate dehydratase